MQSAGVRAEKNCSKRHTAVLIIERITVRISSGSFIVFVRRRMAAAPCIPLIYHPMCFLISRTAMCSPLYCAIRSKCLSSMAIRSSSSGGSGRPSPLQSDAASLNIHGLPSAPLAIITPSQSVSSSIRIASSPLKTSPLPMIGTLTALFTSAIACQSALPS